MANTIGKVKKVNEKKLKKQLENKRRIEFKTNAIIFPSISDECNNEMPYIKLKNVNKIYDNNTQAVFDFNLNVKEKEFIVFVGPSGCGKSTSLRMVCGLEEISNGALFIDNKFMNNVAPKDRDIAMVFQSYALYPHMNVYDNLAFSLKIRKKQIPVLEENGNQVLEINKKKIKEINKRIKELELIKIEDDEEIKKLEKNKAEYSPEIFEELHSYYMERNDLANKEIQKNSELLNDFQTNPKPKFKFIKYTKSEIDERIKRVSEILQIEQFLYRKPKALSGGQRQRVALGRAIVRDAKIFLMDEPLSNLDAKLRVAMRAEIVSLHKKLGATTIYVTHDQTEAMTMADRIVVMKNGVVQQIGKPKDIYNEPNNLFVATFIGSPCMNIIQGNFNRGEFSIDEKTKIKLSKDFNPNNFYKNEIQRLSQLKNNLEISIKDKNDPNNYVYKIALEKVNNLITIHNKKIDNPFSLNIGIRPEHIEILDKKEKNFDMILKIKVVELLGSEYFLHCDINGQEFIIKTSCDNEFKEDEEIKVKINLERVHFFDVDTEQVVK